MLLQKAQQFALDPALTDAEFASAVCGHMPLDPGITRAVRVLWSAGVECFESCEGGAGHAYPEPTVRFHGGAGAGWNAVAAAQQAGLPLRELHRLWTIEQGEPTGPYWELVFG